MLNKKIQIKEVATRKVNAGEERKLENNIHLECRFLNDAPE
jgi:hypothetical protein